MLAFIDESGSLHLKDSNPFSVLLAVCMPERVHRGVSRQLYSIQNMIIVPRPAHPLNLPQNYLPKPHTFLLQRINAWAERNNQEAVLIYDGNGMNVMQESQLLFESEIGE